jgi:hypothetical protein
MTVLAFVAGSVSSLSAQEKVTFEDHVKPIFRAHCASCHNPDKKTAGLDLTSYINMMQGGSSGAVVEPGDADLSYLYLLITHESEPFMPPSSDKIPAEKIETIKKWIDGGLLETASSKAKMSDKPKLDLSLKDAPSGRPEGPPPMPNLIDRQPVTRTSSLTAVTAIATSPWAPLTAIAGQDQILLYNTQTLELVGVLPFPERDPFVLKFSRNGKLLLAGGGHSAAQGKVVVFNVETGERILTVGDELDAVLAADISADQTLIALGGPSKVVRVYSTATGELLHEIRKHTEWIYCLEFSPDSVLLATADRNGGMHVWEAFTGREYLTLAGHGQAVSAISWRSDSNILASCSEDGTVSLWEMNNGGRVKNWAAHGGGATSLEFTREGGIVSCGRDKTAKLWDQNGAQQKAFPAFPDIATAISYDDESSRVIAGDYSGLIKVFAATDGAEQGTLTPNPPKIEERIATLQEQVKTQTADLTAKTEAAKPIVAAWEKAKADLTNANTLVASTQKANEEATAKVNALKAQIDQLTKEKDAAAAQVATLTPVVAGLKTATEQSAASSAKLPEDKELAAAAAQIKAQFDQKTQLLAAQQKIVTDKTAALTKAATDKTAADQALATATANYQNAVKTQEAATAALPPAEEQAKASQAQVAQSKQALDKFQADLVHWQTELTLSQKLTQLGNQETVVAEKKGLEAAAKELLDAAQAELAAAQQTAQTADANVKQVTATMTAEKTTLDQYTAQLAGLQGETAKLDKGLPMLAETVKKAEEAAAQLKDDKELAAAAAALKQLFDKRTAENAELKKQAEAKQAEVTAQTTKLAEVTKQLEAAQAALVAANAVVTAKTEAVKPVQEKFAAAQAETAKSVQVLDALKKEVEAVRALLKPKVAEAQQASVTP